MLTTAKWSARLTFSKRVIPCQIRIEEYKIQPDTRTTRVLYPTEDFSSSLCILTGSGDHPASCPMGTGGKAWLGHDADHSPPSSAEIKYE
jgi:hypothetical protein